MRWAASVAALGLVIAVFALTSPPEPEATPAPPAPTPPAPEAEDPTVETEEPVATTVPDRGPPAVSRVLGILPDGTRYSVRIDPGVRDRVTGVTLGVMFDIDGRALPAGEGEVRFSPSSEPGYRYGLYRITAEDVTVTIRFREDILERLGPDAERIITSSIRLSTTRGLPVLELDAPFRWPAGPEFPVPLEVHYEDFVIRAGCESLAVACSRTGAVQLIPRAEPWPRPMVTISADALRPTWSDSYLDPGPLTPRTSQDVVWTGSEMIVWGGTDGESELIDGAAFDPELRRWRMLPPAPLPVDQASRAVWAGSSMVVVGEGATLAYHPGSREWSALAEGRPVERTAPPPVWDGEHLYLWRLSIERLHPDDGEWVSLPAPPMEVNPDPLLRSLHAASGLLFAVSAPDPCDGPRTIAAWDGSSWAPIPTPDLDGRFRDCSPPRHTGVVQDRLMVWNASNGTALLYDPAGERWVEAHGFPFGVWDLSAGGLDLGDRILVAEGGRAALYGVNVGRWLDLPLPGWGTASETVWTGSQVLMWGMGDAWQWTLASPGADP